MVGRSWVVLGASFVAGCLDLYRVEVPRLDDEVRSAFVVVEKAQGTGVIAADAGDIRRSDGPLAKLPGAARLTVLPYPCTLNQLGVAPGEQELADPSDLRPLPQPIDPQVLDLDGEGPPEGWRPAGSEELEAARGRPVDVDFLRCPSLVALDAMELTGTSSAYGHVALPLEEEWIVLTEVGRYFRVPREGGPARLDPAGLGPPIIGAFTRSASTYAYTKDGRLLAGPLDRCLPGEGCFRTVATGGPTGRNAFLAPGAGPETVHVLVHDPDADRSYLLRAGPSGFTETATYTLGFDPDGIYWISLLGGVVPDGEEVAALDVAARVVRLIRDDGSIETSAVPDLDGGPTTIDRVPGFGTLVGYGTGSVAARDPEWAELLRVDGAFYLTAILPIDEGLLLIGQSGMNVYLPELGKCAQGTGMFVTAWSASKLGDDYLVLSQPWTEPVVATVLHRENPIPACLDRE